METSDPSFDSPAIKDNNGQLVYEGELVMYSSQLCRVVGLDETPPTYPGSSRRMNVWLRLYGEPDKLTRITLTDSEQFGDLLRLTPLEQLAAVGRLQCL